jgi:hypothetical protein
MPDGGKNPGGTLCSRRSDCCGRGFAGVGRCASAIPADMVKPTMTGSAKRSQMGKEQCLKQLIMGLWGARAVPYWANSPKLFYSNDLG